MGYYDGDDPVYAGKDGTGSDHAFLEDFRKRLDRLARSTSHFAGELKVREDVTWITPELAGEFGFMEWTGAGELRHPRFLGLRRDKCARDVVWEEMA